MNTHLRALLCLSTAVWLAPGVAMAHDAADTTTQTDTAIAPKSEAGVKEIIVTATRRATSLQTVPATISVATGETLSALGVKNSQGLESIVPGVIVAVSGGVTPFIRGIGTFNAGFSESSVGVYIDGIYLPNSTGVLFSFNNVERIEALKGPQGTLYGRNTSGGLVNIITKAPSKTATMDASVSYES